MKYPQIYSGEWIEPSDQKDFNMCCCHCGLVHKLSFRIVKGKVQFKAVIDNRATGQVRRHLPRT